MSEEQFRPLEKEEEMPIKEVLNNKEIALQIAEEIHEEMKENLKLKPLHEMSMRAFEFFKQGKISSEDLGLIQEITEARLRELGDIEADSNPGTPKPQSRILRRTKSSASPKITPRDRSLAEARERMYRRQLGDDF